MDALLLVVLPNNPPELGAGAGVPPKKDVDPNNPLVVDVALLVGGADVVIPDDDPNNNPPPLNGCGSVVVVVVLLLPKYNPLPPDAGVAVFVFVVDDEENVNPPPGAVVAVVVVAAGAAAVAVVLVAAAAAVPNKPPPLALLPLPILCTVLAPHVTMILRLLKITKLKNGLHYFVLGVLLVLVPLVLLNYYVNASTASFEIIVPVLNSAVRRTGTFQTCLNNKELRSKDT
jgi:hypothetical protein